jgi:hypothetical protein
VGAWSPPSNSVCFAGIVIAVCVVIAVVETCSCNGPTYDAKDRGRRRRLYKYFEDTLRDVRVKHTYLNRSIPESTVAFATKYVDGAVGQSGKKIRVNRLQSKWALIFN